MLTEIRDFSPYFHSSRVIPETDAPMMERILRLRFEVYCQECGFLNELDYPDSRESDPHDTEAAHFCAIDLRDGLAGYVRLVMPDQQGKFPFQYHCADLFSEAALPDARHAGEISRLMVHSNYRRRRGDILAGITVASDTAPVPERRTESPQIMLSLFRQMYAYSLVHNIRFWYAAMERPLARALTRLGFAFNQIGPQTDYYGPVAPYLADLRELETKVGAADPELLTWMRAARA